MSNSSGRPRPSYEPYDAPPPPSRRFAAEPQYRPRMRKTTWPPSPSVEDETASLHKEVFSAASPALSDDEPPTNTKGAVDQDKVIEDIERPLDQRFVWVPPINTDFDEPLVFTERVSTPYAYTKPQKESTAPSPSFNLLSPDPITLNASRSSGGGTPTFGRHDPVSKPAPCEEDAIFDDSDLEPEDTTFLRTAERKPARYSFVKSDLQKEDLRANLSNVPHQRDHDNRESDVRRPNLQREESTRSSKDVSYAQSPRSSTSFLNNKSSSRQSKSSKVEPSYHTTSRTPSRPVSPVQSTSMPRVPSKLRDSAPNSRSPSRPSSRPSSRGNDRPTTPLSYVFPVRSASPPRPSVTDSDWHATYPPATVYDRSGPPEKFSRYDSMPVPAPRIDVRSPSPARPSEAPAALPYPVDDRPLDVFMPSEAHYQFDHSTVSSPRQILRDIPQLSTTPPPKSPRPVDEAPRTPKSGRRVREDDTPRTRMSRSNSTRSQASIDDRAGRRKQADGKVNLDRPLPSCPRTEPTSKHDDWYSLRSYRHFDLCPSCYEGVFSGTPFAVEFSQTRLGDRPVERVCDFSSPWVRLAWLLTIKQRVPSLEFIFSIADVLEIDRPCPQDRELGSDRVAWYGIPDHRDGIHVANFAMCSSDKRMIESLFPTLKGCFTRLPSSFSSLAPEKYMCSLRTTSRRFPKYLDLLVELDAEAQDLNQRPNLKRFVQMARENSYKGECAKDKSYLSKPWHFAPSLPEFTVCEECYEELIWPATQSRTTPVTIPRLFNKTIQLVPHEDPDVGSSCCLYSPRMRKVFEVAVREEDFQYLKRKATDRRRAEARIARERKSIIGWMMGYERGSSQWQRAKSELKGLDKEWAVWE